jgi:hypothetical protein
LRPEGHVAAETSEVALSIRQGSDPVEKKNGTAQICNADNGVERRRRNEPGRNETRHHVCGIDHLIIVDMQNDFLHPDGAFGQRARRQPERLAGMSLLAATIPMVKRLLDGFRDARRPVVHRRFARHSRRH